MFSQMSVTCMELEEVLPLIISLQAVNWQISFAYEYDTGWHTKEEQG